MRCRNMQINNVVRQLMTSIKGAAWTRASSCLDLIKCPGNLNKFLE